MQGKGLVDKGQTLLFRVTNVIISKAQTALVPALNKLLFSISPSTCTDDSLSSKDLLSGYCVLAVVGNATVTISDKCPVLLGHTFCEGDGAGVRRWNCLRSEIMPSGGERRMKEEWVCGQKELVS